MGDLELHAGARVEQVAPGVAPGTQGNRRDHDAERGRDDHARGAVERGEEAEAAK